MLVFMGSRGALARQKGPRMADAVVWDFVSWWKVVSSTRDSRPRMSQMSWVSFRAGVENFPDSLTCVLHFSFFTALLDGDRESVRVVKKLPVQQQPSIQRL
jgi:hypothetical protein